MNIYRCGEHDMYEQVWDSEVKNKRYLNQHVTHRHEVESEHVGLYIENKLRFVVYHKFLQFKVTLQRKA